MVSNGAEFLKVIKKEEGDEVSQVQRGQKQQCSPNPEPSIRRVENIPLRCPAKYIIRQAPGPTTASALKRVYIARSMFSYYFPEIATFKAVPGSLSYYIHILKCTKPENCCPEDKCKILVSISFLQFLCCMIFNSVV
ncbi:hypothetical protein COOONC_05719 [Cooperia oncophora]